MTTETYYIVIKSRENGKPICTDAKLPIYWLKKIAEQKAEIFGGIVKKVTIKY